MGGKGHSHLIGLIVALLDRNGLAGVKAELSPIHENLDLLVLVSKLHALAPLANVHDVCFDYVCPHHRSRQRRR